MGPVFKGQTGPIFQGSSRDGTNNCPRTPVINYWGLHDPWQMRRICCLEGSVTKYHPTLPNSPEEPRTILTQPQSFYIAVLLVLVDWTNNITCTACRYEYVHSRSLHHLHTHSFSSLVIASVPKGKEVRGRPPCFFTFYKNICVTKRSYLSKVCDATTSNLINIK